MAYLVELGRRCPCGKQAVVQLFNHHNASLGMVCRTCGKRRLADQQKRETAGVPVGLADLLGGPGSKEDPPEPCALFGWDAADTGSQP